MSTEVGGIAYYNEYVKWNIKEFRQVWRKGEWFTSPTFIYSGRKCLLSVMQSFANKNILLHFKSSSSFCQNLCIEICLCTEGFMSDFLRSQLEQGTFMTTVSMDFQNFYSENNGTPLYNYLTVLFRLYVNDGVLIPDEFKEEAVPASEKVSEIESSYQNEINSKMINKLLEDLKSLRVSGENSDVKLVVRGKEFPAHRLILSTRSPVFKAMLRHDTSEKERGTVNIDDCDPDSFQAFLDYVYTGSTKHVNIGNVTSLYATSDKYLMSELKEACVSLMKTNMSVERFCSIATMALLHSEKELLEISKDFFFKNSKEIIETENWETFFEENPTEAYEHFMKPSISRR